MERMERLKRRIPEGGAYRDGVNFTLDLLDNMENTKGLETEEMQLERFFKKLDGYWLEWCRKHVDKKYFEGIDDTLSAIYGEEPVIRAFRKRR